MNWRRRKKLLKRRLWRVPSTQKSNGSNKSLHTMKLITGMSLKAGTVKWADGD